MADLVFNKNNFDINKINELIAEYCKENNIHGDELMKYQLICEEFLSNMLFPYFDGDINLDISPKDGNTNISFGYVGENYMNRINQTSILSLKILQKQTKGIDVSSLDGKTVISFKV